MTAQPHILYHGTNSSVLEQMAAKREKNPKGIVFLQPKSHLILQDIFPWAGNATPSLLFGTDTVDWKRVTFCSEIDNARVYAKQPYLLKRDSPERLEEILKHKRAFIEDSLTHGVLHKQLKPLIEIMNKYHAGLVQAYHSMNTEQQAKIRTATPVIIGISTRDIPFCSYSTDGGISWQVEEQVPLLRKNTKRIYCAKTPELMHALQTLDLTSSWKAVI